MSDLKSKTYYDPVKGLITINSEDPVGPNASLLNSQPASFYQNPANMSYMGAGGTTAQSIQAILDRQGFYPETWGAIGDGVRDDTTAVQSAANAAANAGGALVLCPGKNYKVTSTITIPGCHVDAFGAILTFPANFNSIGILYGSSAYTLYKEAKFPKMVMTRSAYGWASTPNAIAIKCLNTLKCNLWFSVHQNWFEGVRFAASGSKGACYNSLFHGHYENCAIGLHYLADDTTSWVNENDNYGGRASIKTPEYAVCTSSIAGTVMTVTARTSGTSLRVGMTVQGTGIPDGVTISSFGTATGGNGTYNLSTDCGTIASQTSYHQTSGTRSILLDSSTTNLIVDNISFYRWNFEGDGYEFALECKGASHNTFFGCRWEMNHPRMVCNGTSTATSSYNMVVGGYAAQSAPITISENSYSSKNCILRPEYQSYAGNSSTGLLRLENVGSDNYPNISFWPNTSGALIHNPGSSTLWTVGFGTNLSEWKATADSVFRLRVQSSTGKIIFNDGAQAYGAQAYLAPLGNTGIQQKLPVASPGTPDNQGLAMWADETNGNLVLKYKTAGGVSKTISLPLAFNGNDNSWKPSDYGLVTWSFDPIAAVTSLAPAVAGTLQLVKVHLTQAATITNIVLSIANAGSGLTDGQCFAAIYQGGNLLGVTADQATNWQSNGPKTMALVTPVAAPSGDILIAFWANGTTLPTFSRAAGVGIINNGNVRFGTSNAGTTTTAPSTLGAITSSAVAWWVGLS